ncbi:hypothetical protein OQA88_741 [Cercophora sp. LCS_1]
MRPALLFWATTALALTSTSPRHPAPDPDPGAANIQIHGFPIHREHPGHLFSTGQGTSRIGVDLVTRQTKDDREDYRVPTCTRKPHKLHSRRKWTITYDGDDLLNGNHCGKSIKKALKTHVTCWPITDWACVADGKPGMGGVKIGFSTGVSCRDKKVTRAIAMGTGGRVDVRCEHL